MALDFPSGAIVGTVYTGTNGAVYTFDGIKWRISSQSTDIIPSINDLYNLGSTSSIWNNLFVGSAFIKDTTSATSTNTGALQVTGGVGIGGSLYVGGPVYSQGIRLTGNEIDPVFTASSAVSITATNITNWNTAYSWGDHATRGYLTATVSSHLLPGSNSLYDLGSTSSQWRSLYVSTNTIYIGGNALSVVDGNLSLNGISAANLGQFKISGNNLGTVDNPNTGGWGGYDMYIDPGNGSNAFIYIPGVPNQAASTNLQISNNSTAGAIQLFGRGGVQIVTNNGVNEKVFEFADNGSLIFPNSTIQSSAWTGSTSTLVNGTYTLQLLVDGNLTLPGEVHGKQLYGFDGTPNGRAVNITPASNASDKKFSLRVDQYGETFTRAYLDMPTAQNNKQVAISFAHQNNTVGYIFNQGADTFDDGLNNAFNIFYNAGDIKLTAMTTGTGVFKTWKFGQSGGLTSPDGTTSTGASVYVPYATSSSYKITTELDMGGPPYMPYTFEVQGAGIILPNGNGFIRSGPGGGLWSLDSANYSFNFPNTSRINYGDGSSLSTGTLQVDVRDGGVFEIKLNDSNKTWAFNTSGDLTIPSSGDIVFDSSATSYVTGVTGITFVDGTTQTTSANQNYVPGNLADWVGSPTVATFSSGLDELANRTKTLESAGGGSGNNKITSVFMNNSNSNLGMAANTETKIPFDTAATGHDAGDFNLSTNRFQPTVAGWYDIKARLQWSGSWSANVEMLIYKNTTLEKYLNSTWIGNGGGIFGSALVYFDGVSDYAEIRVIQRSGGFQFVEFGQQKSWFQASWDKA